MKEEAISNGGLEKPSEIKDKGEYLASHSVNSQVVLLVWPT